MSDKKPTLHLIMGLPGAGKSTFAKHLQKITKAVRLSSDEFRLLIYPEPTFSQQEHDNLYGIIDHNVEHLLDKGYSVIYDANLNRKLHRQEKYALAKKYDAKVVLWCINTPDKLSKQRRIDDQDHNLLPEGETPANMFDRIAAVYELPENEPHIEFDGTNITEEKVRQALKEIS
jgi:predicted kinase